MALISRSATDLAFAKTEAVHVVVIAVVVVIARWLACKLLRGPAPAPEPESSPGGGGALFFVACCLGGVLILLRAGKHAHHALQTPRPAPVPTRTVIVQRVVAAAHPLLTGTDIVLIIAAVLLAVTACAAITRRYY